MSPPPTQFGSEPAAEQMTVYDPDDSYGAGDDVFGDTREEREEGGDKEPDDGEQSHRTPEPTEVEDNEGDGEIGKIEKVEETGEEAWGGEEQTAATSGWEEEEGQGNTEVEDSARMTNPRL